MTTAVYYVSVVEHLDNGTTVSQYHSKLEKLEAQAAKLPAEAEALVGSCIFLPFAADHIIRLHRLKTLKGDDLAKAKAALQSKIDQAEKDASNVESLMAK